MLHAKDAQTRRVRVSSNKLTLLLHSQTKGLTNHRNINVFALAFVLSLSLTITILDLLLLRFLMFLSKFRRAFSPGIEEWIGDGVFQLQRRAYEANGEGTWKLLDKEVPTTTGAEQLSVLPLNARPTTPATMTLSHTTGSRHTTGSQQGPAPPSLSSSRTPSVYSQSAIGNQTPQGSSVPLGPGPSRSPSPILPASTNSTSLPAMSRLP